CLRKGVSINFETEVLEVQFEGSQSTTRVQNKNGEISEIKAHYLIDSSGFGRVIAKQLGLEAEPQVAEHASIFTQIKDVRRPAGKEGTFITFEIIETEVWFWFIPFSNGNTSVGFVGPTEWIERFDGSNSEIFRQMLPFSKKYYAQFNDLPF